MKDYRTVYFNATLGADGSIALPPDACALLKIEPGDVLLALVRDGEVVMIRKPENTAAAMRELCPEIWKDSANYLDNERDSW